MDIHEQVNQIVSQKERQALRFEFHQRGATIVLCNHLGEHRFEIDAYDLIRLGINTDFLFKMMAVGTVSYFQQGEARDNHA